MHKPTVSPLRSIFRVWTFPAVCAEFVGEVVGTGVAEAVGFVALEVKVSVFIDPGVADGICVSDSVGK